MQSNSKIIALAFSLVLLPWGFSFAQAPNADGLGLANSMFPSSAGQVVNPSGVNATAWSGSTDMKQSNVNGTGQFANPTTSSADYAKNNFSGGLTNMGNKSMDDCASYVPTGKTDSASIAKDQYCSGVNFMANRCIQPNSSQQQIIGGTGASHNAVGNCSGTFGGGLVQSYVLSGNDKDMANKFPSQANNNAGINGGCQVISTTVPAKTENHDCVKSENSSAQTCTQELNPECSIGFGDLTSASASGPNGGGWQTWISKRAPGVYDYRMSRDSCLSSASAFEIDFNIQDISWGSSITVHIDTVDDMAAVGVNGHTVFAGRPNSGGWYQIGDEYWGKGSTGFAFASGACIGYAGGIFGGRRCVQWLDVKLLDYCPAGYGSPAFCYDGALYISRSEGNGTWGGTLPETAFPLVTGDNKIQLFWGTQTGNSQACGNIVVTGTITNKVPVCTATWLDNCTALETSEGSFLGNPE